MATLRFLPKLKVLLFVPQPKAMKDAEGNVSVHVCADLVLLDNAMRHLFPLVTITFSSGLPSCENFGSVKKFQRPTAMQIRVCRIFFF